MGHEGVILRVLVQKHTLIYDGVDTQDILCWKRWQLLILYLQVEPATEACT